jgi:integrase
VQHPKELTPAGVVEWIMSPPDQRWRGAGRHAGRPPANNTIHSRASAVRSFLIYCEELGEVPSGCRIPRVLSRTIASYPVTYGKKQSANPARFLTRHEAYVQLIGVCADGTVVGLRDELICRLGLLGMRCSAIRNLRLGDLDLDNGVVRWIDKRSKACDAELDDRFLDTARRYLDAYRRGHNEPLHPVMPFICERPPTKARDRLRWGVITRSKDTITKVVVRVAKDAGLGHVTPHDLRRTTASILHNATTADGAHFFDLLDIQKVLHHTDPAITMKCYIDQISTDVKKRAARFRD